MAAHPQHRQKGFLILEVLAGAVLLAILATALLQASNAYQNYYAKMQVRLAADLLAADIRRLQQDSLYGEVESRYIRTLSSGYDTYERNKKVKSVRFADYAWDVTLSWPKRFNVQFSGTGSPTATGTLVLEHQSNKKFSCTLAVQPITGRVVIVEE